MNLMQQMYFAFATSFKTNNFFCFVYETHNTHTQNQNQETNNKHNNADEVNKKKGHLQFFSSTSFLSKSPLRDALFL